MNNSEMKKVAVKAGIFGLISITVMLQRAATKHIMITDAAGTYIDRGSDEDSYNVLIDKNVKENQMGKLVIPLSKSVSSDDIVLEDRYIDHELRIYIDSREDGFYLDNAVLTDLDILESAVCIKQNDSGSVCLDFKLDDFYASTSSLTENSTIEVEFGRPGDLYDNIVVVDARGDGTAEAEAALDIALFLKEAAAKDGIDGTKFYFTKLTDSEVGIDKRVGLVNECDADLVVEIEVATSDDPDDNGVMTYYNDTYFLRNFNNAMFADIIEKNCAYSMGTEAIGIASDDGMDEILQAAEVPAARVSICYETNNENGGQIDNSDSKRKAAQGIYIAVKKALEEKR